LKKWLKIALAIALALIVIFVGISAYLGYSMTRVTRVALEETPATYDLTYEDVSFPSLDKELTLRGWFLPVPGSERVIIMVHGNGYHRADPEIGMLDIAAHLVDRNFNVLMFDLRGYGESDGNMVSGGYHEKKDVEGAVSYLKGRGFDRIGVLGFSLGAVSTLMAAAEDPDIKVVVSDSSFADLNDIMSTEFSKRTKAPRLFLHPILFMIKLMYGVDFAAIRPVDRVAEIAPRPILFIHGEEDEVIPVAHAYRLFEASQNPENQLWVVAGARHTRAFKVQPDEYISRVASFFSDNL
jgi:fermentation-respiration switch protein FrsA (DUF1100 family)